MSTTAGITLPTRRPIITEATGIRVIEVLYVQLLYRCQFRCAHCFHGDRLAWRDAYTLDEAIRLIEMMHADYGTTAVNLLGGEPFLYRHLVPLLQHTKRRLEMRTEICTNGYRIGPTLAQVAPDLDLLRVSLEGMEPVNDAIRHPGSFRQAIAALDGARRLGVPTGVTMTVTATNIEDVVPLARLLSELDVTELKLHHLRAVGYAAAHTDLSITEASAYQRMWERIAAAALPIPLLVDDELSVESSPVEAGYSQVVHRIESDPRGTLTMSCNAVGTDAHAFIYDKALGRITRSESSRDEVLLGIPQVTYDRVH